MRRDLIFVLIAILSLLMYSSIVQNFRVDTNKVLLDTVVGAVGAGNFSYWHLGHMGPLQIELTSITGDADLYIADNVRPSYETDQNNFSSITCGPDIVNIPSSFPRPIGIGVFGHWSHDTSEYSIQVFKDLSASPVFYEEISEPKPVPLVKDHNTEKRAKERAASHREEDMPRFAKLLNILNVMFELFVF